MKKIISMSIAAMFGGLLFIPKAVNAQPVSDREVIPVAVTLNQVLRLAVTTGGNIEFVFNQIGQYQSGINSGGGSTGLAAFYMSTFDIASSTNWQLNMGAENATFLGTDNVLNTLPLNNVGLRIFDIGTNTLAGGMLDNPAGALTGVIALPVFPTTVIGDGTVGNAGDELENRFQIRWRAGTTEPTMTTVRLIDLVPSPAPDRYVTNVLLDLQIQ